MCEDGDYSPGAEMHYAALLSKVEANYSAVVNSNSPECLQAVVDNFSILISNK